MSACSYESKGAIAILEKNNIAFDSSNIYQKQYQQELPAFTLPSQARAFFLTTSGINVFTGVEIELSGLFVLDIHGNRRCVPGRFWKEADGDRLLLCQRDETIWYYAHGRDKIKRFCEDMTGLLEKKLTRYLSEH